MSYGKVTVTPASGDVISTANAKAHLRVEHDAEDSYIASLVAVAVEHVQTQTGRQLLTATYDISFDRFPAGAEPQLLPLAPLQSVSQIVYVDTSGAATTINSASIAADYRVVTGTEPGQIAPAYGNVWPYAADVPAAVRYRIVCGYGTASDVPDQILHAVRLLVGHWYENREDVVVGTITSNIPRGVGVLLESMRFDDLVDYQPATRRVTHHRQGWY